MKRHYSSVIVGLVVLGTTLISESTAFYHQPVMASGDWYHNHDLIQRRVERLLDSAFFDPFDFGPHSISSYRRPSCSQQPAVPRPPSQCGDERLPNPSVGTAERKSRPQTPPTSDEEQSRQTRLAQLKEERLRQAELREQHERVERETNEEIRELEAESERVREEHQHGEETYRQRIDEMEKLRKQRERQEEQERLRKQRERQEEQERLRQQRERQEEERLIHQQRREEQTRLRREEMIREAKQKEEIRQKLQQEREGRLREEQLRRERTNRRAAESHNSNRGSRHEPNDPHGASHPDSQRYAQKLIEHMAQGYFPEDLTVSIKDGRILISGNHICTCTEDCISKEFSRSYALPSHIDPYSVRASTDAQGRITLTGLRQTGRHTDPAAAIEVRVTGEGEFKRPSADELRACLNKKGGIRLSRVSKRTGRAVEETEPQWAREPEPLIDSQALLDDEFSTVEVEY